MLVRDIMTMRDSNQTTNVRVSPMSWMSLYKVEWFLYLVAGFNIIFVTKCDAVGWLCSYCHSLNLRLDVVCETSI